MNLYQNEIIHTHLSINHNESLLMGELLQMYKTLEPFFSWKKDRNYDRVEESF